MEKGKKRENGRAAQTKPKQQKKGPSDNNTCSTHTLSLSSGTRIGAIQILSIVQVVVFIGINHAHRITAI